MSKQRTAQLGHKYPRPLGLSQCLNCNHLDHGDFNCPAYPEGIPEDVRTNKTRHNKVLPGQTGAAVQDTFLDADLNEWCYQKSQE